ncbi:MAG: CxxxxCH/CxxCH domain-containing protein [Desulfuromonadales bacterium]|nr:CxxxxCH/CxxCH domain-containing protein [Desulfuromonadales bacterium]
MVVQLVMSSSAFAGKPPVPPTLSVTAPVNSELINSVPYNVYGTCTAGDNALTEVTVNDGSGAQTATGTANWSYSWNPADATYDLTVICTDAAALNSTVNVTGVVVNTCVDTDTATMTISDPIESATIGGVYTVYGQVGVETAPLTMGTVEFSLNGGAWTTATGNNGSDSFTISWDTTAVADGPATLQVRGFDPDCGGTNLITSAVRNVTVNNACSDGDLAVLSIANPTESQVISGTYRVKLGVATETLPGNLTGVEFNLNGAGWVAAHGWDGSNWYFDWDTTTVTDGAVTIDARATDPDCGDLVNATQRNAEVSNSGPSPTLTSCAGCHGYPSPLVDSATRDASTGTFVGDHATHNYNCSLCHVVPATETDADFAHRTGTIDMANPLNNAGGTYSKGSSFAQSNSPTPGTCSNINCHGGTVTPEWGVGTTSCDSCHALPPASGAHATHYSAKGWTTGATTDCTICHPDNTAGHSDVSDGTVLVSGTNMTYTAGSCSGTGIGLGCHNEYATPDWTAGTATCTSCHLAGGANPADPVSGLHNMTAAGVQSHDHTLAAGACVNCHSSTKPATHADGNFTADGLNNTDRFVARANMTYTEITPASGRSGSCFGTGLTGCHSDNGAWSRLWSTEADSTATVVGSARCNVCHGQWSSIAGSSGWLAGTTHYKVSTSATDNRGQGTHDNPASCDQCHAYETLPGNHNTATPQVTMNSNGTTYARGTGGSSGFAGCSSCHGGATDAAYRYPNSVFTAQTVVGPGIDAGCDSCHGGDYNADGWTNNNFWPAAGATHPRRGGEHVAHISALMAKLGYSAATITDQQQKTMCAYCHTYTLDPGESGHTDAAPAEVGSFNPLWSAMTGNYPSTGDDGTYTAGNQSCSNIDCHNNKATDPGFNWFSGATSTCTMCHTAGGAGVNPRSGLHSPGTLISGMPHDDNFASGATCTTCHSTMAAVGASNHGNGVDNGNAVASLGLTAGMYTQTSTASNGAGTCSGGSVAAGACHGVDPVDAGSWARRWDDTISYANNGTTECAGCHGGFNNDWTFGSDNVVGDFSVSHDRNWDGDGNPSEVIGNHSGSTQTTRCNSCHVYGDSEYAWGTYHRDRRITMNSTMGYSGTAFNCTTHCHSNNTGHNLEAASSANWATRGNSLAGPPMSCVTCHNGGGSGGLAVSSASPHTIVGTRAGYNTFVGCEQCHPQHTGGVLVANETRVGINYTADSRTGFRLGGTATSGTTEAQICWNCHGNLTYQATAISEWGVNNKQPGTPAAVTAYNWGTLNQTNWIGASWTSAQSTLFSYKTGAIQSTHAANFAATTPGMDTVANIRCSYCHDVHDTYGTSGKPYLRGTWWTNPYLEDGAPVSSITYAGVVPFGNVPRAQASQNQLGGYQIDQNNNNPTASGGSGTGGAWTVADSAGLCWLCHNKNRAGTNVTVDTLDWFGTNDWATNGSGQINGHSNAVVGGTGSNRVNIFRSSWRAPSMGLTTDGTRPDMGYANHGTGVGYGYRAIDARGFIGHTPGTNAGNDRPYGGSLYNWGATVDDATTDVLYHKFSCSKCHNPHASRLPRLMVTNCLDTKHNTWDNVRTGITALTVSSSNDNGVTLNATSAPDSWGRTWSNVQSAQNCHRLADPAVNPTNTTNYGKGWNNVTPWAP